MSIELIDGEEFNYSLIALRRKLSDRCDKCLLELHSEKLKDFYPAKRSTNFGSLISFLNAECDNFTDDYENEEFYDSIKDCFLKLQQVLNEE